LAGPAHAQTDGETEVAKQRFREGVRLYDQGDYDKARLAFLQAYLLKPHPTVLLNLAQSELRAGRHAEAAENFSKYIRQNPAGQAMEHAKARFEEARQKVAELNVEVTAPGAVITVDGAEVGRSPLPNVVYLMPGRHTIGARKANTRASRTLDATAGQRVYVTLELQDSGVSPVPAASVGAAESTSVLEPNQGQLSNGGAMDESRSQGFFSWIADSPAAIATVSIAGLALATSAVLGGFANNRYAAANDVKGKIMENLQERINSGLIVAEGDRTVTPCGESGIANGMATFGEQYSEDAVNQVVSDYASACALFSQRSDSGDRLKTLSLVSLGVGAFATVGTIVWYFSDTGSSEGDTAKGSREAKGARASLSPVLSRDMQGLWLDVAF
jgi:hypothetical protein